MINLKTSKRIRFETEDDLGIALSQIESSWNSLCETHVLTLKDKIHIKFFVLYFYFIFSYEIYTFSINNN